MVKNKRKDKGVHFKTIRGENIKLILDKSEIVIKITITNSNHTSSNRRKIILLIVAFLNLLCLVFHLLNLQIIVIVFILSLLELYRLLSIVNEEELILVKNLGIQLTTKYTTGLKTVFIPFEQIRRIFINEVIYRSRVIYVLSLLTKDTDVTEKLVPLFFNTLPRIDCLKVIYKNLKALER